MNLAFFLLLLAHFHLTPTHAQSRISNPDNIIITISPRSNNSLLFITRKRTGKTLHLFKYPVEALNIQNCTLRTAQASQPEVDQILAEVAHDQIVTSALVKSSEGHDVLFATRSNWRANVDTVFYDLDSKPNERLFIESVLTWEGHIWISAGGEVGVLYQLQTKPVASLQKMAFKMIGEASSDLVDANELAPASERFNICQHGGEQQIYLSKSDCPLSVNWSQVTSGMSYKGMFWLFEPEFVYVFERAALEKPEVKVTLTKKTVKEFFI